MSILATLCAVSALIVLVLKGFPFNLKGVEWTIFFCFIGILTLFDFLGYCFPEFKPYIRKVDALFLAFSLIAVSMLFSFHWLFKVGVFLSTAGGISNLLVIALNEFRMPAINVPVIAELVNKKLDGYVLVGPDTHLSFLGDIMYVTWPITNAFSIGDIFVVAGSSAILIWALFIF
ncbi:MAG: DUF5317 family protein [Candidatus Yanofskybacteria bacterium]|nr:DUF5317 family protein [Candidatus Yanofskybacteria bacterium]